MKAPSAAELEPASQCHPVMSEIACRVLISGVCPQLQLVADLLIVWAHNDGHGMVLYPLFYPAFSGPSDHFLASAGSLTIIHVQALQDLWAFEPTQLMLYLSANGQSRYL